MKPHEVRAQQITNRPPAAALYYPYIHIRSEHWLKATLLCFPVVKRIVPESYEPEDSLNIRKYIETEGPYGPLLQPVPAGSGAAYDAQKRLLRRLQENEKALVQFAREQVPRPDEYFIHPAKFSDDLIQHLEARGLAWRSEHPAPYGHRSWYALHPRLGSAIMTTLGLAIAQEQRLDVVTDNTGVHETLLATKEDAIFDALFGGDRPSVDPTVTDARHELGDVPIAVET